MVLLLRVEKEVSEDQIEKIYVVAPIPCPSCGGELFDYQRDSDPFFWCLNGNCNTFKVPKEEK